VVRDLEPAWAHTFLHRTRMLDLDSKGDVLAVINHIFNALHMSFPLPQITPYPVLDRFMLRRDSLNVVHKESEDDYGNVGEFAIRVSLSSPLHSRGCHALFRDILRWRFHRLRNDHSTRLFDGWVGEQYHIDGMGMSVKTTEV